jgi:uncharacterized protein YkwD
MHSATTRATNLTSTRVRLAAAALAAAFAFGSLAAAAPALATTRGDGLRAAANEWRRCVSDYETDIECVRVDPIQGTNLLDSIADARADQMRDSKELEHDMAYVQYRLNKADVCWTSFGEIIAWRSGGTYSYEGTVFQWWNSDPHREIMTGAGFDAAGGSWATASNGSHYSVMIFVGLCSSELRSTSTWALKPTQTYSPDRPMVLLRGKHTAYKFNASGEVVDTKTVSLDRRRSPDSAGRAKVDGTAYLKVSSGPLQGYWVDESVRQFVRGTTEKHAWSSPRTLRMAEGSYTGLRFDKLGRVTRRHQGQLAHNWRQDASAKAVINGRSYFLMAEGKWAGYWIRDTKNVNPA